MITKEAVDKNKFVGSQELSPLADNAFFTPTARAAFQHILANLKFEEGEKLLLPAYIGITDTEGSGVFDPVEATDTPYEFYPLNEQLALDKDNFEELLQTKDFKAVLVIHYFGFAQNDMKWISEKCKEHDVILIEDCAHTLGSSQKGITLGEFGDLAFFSIHKIIATSDGGILKINNQALGIPPFNEEGPGPETIEQFQHTNFEQTYVRRSINYHYLANELGQTERIKVLYPNLNEETVPLNFPILIEDGKREELYFKLEERGVITVSLYYRLIEAIPKDNHPLSYQISNSILNLPVHQDTTMEDLYQLVTKLKAILKDL